MGRFEYKYYIPMEYIDDLRKSLKPYIEYDPFSKLQPNYEYTVRSIYLDSYNLFTYHEKIDGLRFRKKFRIRGYNNLTDDSLVFLEIKRKDGDIVSKDRVSLQYKNLNGFLRTKDYSLLNGFPKQIELKKEYADNFIYYYHLHNLKPAVIVTYDREAFECKSGTGLRITFDKNLRTKRTNGLKDLFNENDLKRVFNKYFVLEIKFGKILPNWLIHVLSRYNVMRTSVSKYSWCIEETYFNHLVNLSLRR